MGRLLREAVQFPRDPLLRHRGQADRPAQPGDDQPLRQDPHPDQRIRRRPLAIEEYLAAYHGEGIQHIALATDDIFATVEALRGRGVAFVDPPPDSYYAAVDARLPGHGEDLARLRRDGILIDGAPGPDGGRLLQIFTRTVIGPIFFEIIQRKGDQGFGEGNFKALFEAMEQDQIRRGELKA